MPNKLFIGNLPFNATDAELTDLFAAAGILIANVKVMRDQETGRSRGFAFVELAPEADMESAINQLNGKMLGGRALTVNEAREQKPRNIGGGSGGGFDRNRGRFGRRNGPRGGGGGRDNRQHNGF
ncbi:MAG: RNA-binding protein [Acidobacteria bacterium]|nr:RNA-binding protein [Acidobacteriota bacterium]